MFNPTNMAPAGANAGSTGRGHDCGTVGIQTLPNEKLTVSKSFVDIIRTQVEEALPGMLPGQSYTVKQMCGIDFWNQMTRTQHILAGKCIARTVSEGVLPLEFAQPTSANAKRYRLK